MSEPWFFLQSPPADAAYNMAVDEMLLRTARLRQRPVLRVYKWQQPSVSIGYFQKFPAHLSETHPIVRRPTGGGLVYHGQDTTYTVVVPPGHGLHEISVTDAYCAIHEAVAAALQFAVGRRPSGDVAVVSVWPAEVSAPATADRSYECFQNPVHGDVVAGGRKLAGAAQRRTKWGLLHQGSIAAEVWPAELKKGFAGQLGARFEDHVLTAEEQQLAQTLWREKFSTDAWNRRVL